MPGQGASRGMHCRPPEAEQTQTEFVRGTSWGNRPQTDCEVGGNHLLQRDTTLTSEPPKDGRQRRSEVKRGREGQICLAIGNETRDFLFARSIFVLRQIAINGQD